MMNPTTISPESSSASTNLLGLSAKGKKGKSGLQKGLFSRLLVKLQQTAQQEGGIKAGKPNTANAAKKTSLQSVASVKLLQIKGNKTAIIGQQTVINPNKSISKDAKVTALLQAVQKTTVQTGIKSESKATASVETLKKGQVLIAAVQSEQSKSIEKSKEAIATIQEAPLMQQRNLTLQMNNVEDTTQTKGKPKKQQQNNQQLQLLQEKDVKSVEANPATAPVKGASFATALNDTKVSLTKNSTQADAKANLAASSAVQSNAQNSKAFVQSNATLTASPTQTDEKASLTGATTLQRDNKASPTTTLGEKALTATGKNNHAQNIRNKSTVQNDVKSPTANAAAITKSNPTSTAQASLQVNNNADGVDLEANIPVARAEKSTAPVVDGQQESVKSQQSPIAAVQHRSPNQINAQQQSNAVHANPDSASASNRIIENSSTSSGQDFTSNQEGNEQMFVDANKADSRISKGMDFQAQLAYKSQRSFTPNDAMLEIVRSAKDGSTSLELQLEPANLGKVHVSIQLDAAKQLQVAFTVEHAASRQALEQQMPQLRLALAQQGLDLGGFNMQMNQQQQGNQQQGSAFAGNRSQDADSAAQLASNIENTDTRIGVNLATDGHLSILA